MSVSELFARADPTPTAATITAMPSAGSYKRQISEAVPREERLNGPETIPAAPQQQASGVSRRPKGQDTGISTKAGSVNDTCKSSRTRKPKRHLSIVRIA